QFGARFLINQENFILPVNSTQAVFNQAEPIHNRKIALTDAWTISGTLVNDLRLQYSFFSEATVNPCQTCPQDITINDLLGGVTVGPGDNTFQKRSEEHTSELQSLRHLVCRLLLEKKKTRRPSGTGWSSRRITASFFRTER